MRIILVYKLYIYTSVHPFVNSIKQWMFTVTKMYQRVILRELKESLLLSLYILRKNNDKYLTTQGVFNSHWALSYQKDVSRVLDLERE